MISNKNDEKPKEKEESLEEKLALIVEVVPGGSSKDYSGPMTYIKEGEWENKTAKQIMDIVLKIKNYSIEDQKVIDSIKELYNKGGKIFAGNEEVNGSIDQYVKKQKDKGSGASYMFLRLEVIKSEEGGYIKYG